MPSYRTPSVLARCARCGVEFRVEANRLAAGRGKYCGRACYRPSGTLAERFWPKVTRGPECWWFGPGRERDTYGNILGDDGKFLSAHVAAWTLAAGPVPDGFLVLHTCDNKPCVRNDDDGFYEINGIMRPRRGHLWLGTASENTVDMVGKRRHGAVVAPERIVRGDDHWSRQNPTAVLRGQASGMAKLTDDDVRAIRRQYAAGGISQTELGKRYGINNQSVSNIIRRATWKHIE